MIPPTYLYGNGRLSQFSGANSTYYLGDSLGSVRQLADEDGVITLAKTYEPYGEVMSSVGIGTSEYGYTGEYTSSYVKLLYLRSRYYSLETGRFVTKDSWQGIFKKPMSYNPWLYTYANPINFVDPSGFISCRNSDDPECVTAARSLQAQALQLKSMVQSEDNPLNPVEALAELTRYAYNLFGKDSEGWMWGMTNVLVGLDPNDYYFLSLGIFDIGHNQINGSLHSNRYFVGQNWLPYKRDPINDFYYPGDTVKMEKAVSSEIGDWNPNYFDGTANQAYHFWYFAASDYYDGDLLPFVGNLVHDPYFLEAGCGEDLIGGDGKINLRNLSWFWNPFLRKWPDKVTGTSHEDFMLSLKGMEFGAFLRSPLTSSFIQPDQWIRDNLQTGN